MSVGTAFFPRQRELNTKLAWGEWSGYYAAAVYADFHDIEYNAIREAAAVIDVTPLYKYVVRGPDAAALLDRVLTRDISPRRDRPGDLHAVVRRGRQGHRRRHRHAAGRDRYRVTAADPCYRWFALNATGLDVEIDDVSEATAALALQGRLSREVLERATGQDWSDVRYFRRRPTSIAGVDVDVTRTGYTGDRGYELWIPREGALAVWDRLFEVGADYGLRPAGIRALDVCRVEAGLILIEAEYTSARHAIAPEHKYSPFEIGLGRLVDFDKEARVHREAGAARGARGRRPGAAARRAGARLVRRSRRCSRGTASRRRSRPWSTAPRSRSTGRACRSAARPPSAGGRRSRRWSASARWTRSVTELGTRLSVEWTVEGERGKVAATVVPMPFLDLERKRT